MDVKVPSLAESVTEGEIGTWLKKDGQAVRRGEAILELQTDKASLELAADASGILRTLKAEGDVVRVGEVIARIEEGGMNEGDRPHAERSPCPPGPPAPHPRAAAGFVAVSVNEGDRRSRCALLHVPPHWAPSPSQGLTPFRGEGRSRTDNGNAPATPLLTLGRPRDSSPLLRSAHVSPCHSRLAWAPHDPRLAPARAGPHGARHGLRWQGAAALGHCAAAVPQAGED